MRATIALLSILRPCLPRLLRRGIAVLLVVASAFGPVTMGIASTATVDGLPCAMQMADPDLQAVNGEFPIQDEQKPACPLMLGGVCLTLLAVAQAAAPLPSLLLVAAPAIGPEELAAPLTVSPLLRPPKSL